MGTTGEVTTNMYRCMRCGVWVTQGWHECIPTTRITPDPQPAYYPPYIDNVILERIAKALEKIVQLLEEDKTWKPE